MSGRVFSGGTGRVLPGATAEFAGASTTTDGDGRFALDYAIPPAVGLTVTSPQHATIYEAAPPDGGYLELFATAIEVEQSIDLGQESQIVTPRGLAVLVKPGGLTHLDGTPAKVANIQISRVDLSKSSELLALPGNLDVEVDGKAGKMLLWDAFYVSATEDGKPLQGTILAAPVPDAQKAADSPWWFGPSTANAPPSPTFFTFTPLALVPGFLKPVYGWFSNLDFPAAVFGLKIGPFGSVTVNGASVGVNGPTFFGVGEATGDLGCVRACVKDAAGQPVANAELSATSYSPAVSGSRNTDDSGCVALGLPDIGPLSAKVRVVGEPGSWEGEVDLHPTGSIDDPASCQALPDVTLQPQAASACPSGYLVCGEQCLDPVTGDDCSDLVEQDGGNGELDAGAHEDAGEEQPMLDAGDGHDASTPEHDAGSDDEDAGPDGGGPGGWPTLYVNVETGQLGNPGTLAAPMRTITEALAAASELASARIYVAPGTYSAQNGETFPLVVPQAVQLTRDPQLEGTVTISGGGSYVGSTDETVTTAVALVNTASLSNITVRSQDTQYGYAVTVDGAASIFRDVFLGTNGVRVLWNDPSIAESTFQVESIGLDGCMGGSLNLNSFVGGSIQVHVFGTDLCILNKNTFSDDEGYSSAAVYVDDDARAVLYTNDFTALHGGNILQTGIDQYVDVELGTAENPGKNKFPGESVTMFFGVRVQHDANADIDAYGNDWGDSRENPVCNADVRRSESAQQGYSVNAAEGCNW